MYTCETEKLIDITFIKNHITVDDTSPLYKLKYNDNYLCKFKSNIQILSAALQRPPRMQIFYVILSNNI